MHKIPTPCRSNPIQSNPVFLRKLLSFFWSVLIYSSLSPRLMLYCVEVLKSYSPSIPLLSISVAINKQKKRHQGDPGRSHTPQRPPEITTRF